jgi:ABC-2 type transport system ATP-binding protein
LYRLSGAQWRPTRAFRHQSVTSPAKAVLLPPCDSDITTVVSTEAFHVEALEKFFPPAASGWKAFLHPLAKATSPALRGVSFSVQPGEVVALVGANGAGKSTLLRILTTLLLPTRGRAWVGGFDVERQPGRVLQMLGFHSGSDSSFYARMTARENLEFFASLNNLPAPEIPARISHLADLLHLGAALDRQVRTLSTGTVHRVGLARALLHRPAVVVLDEPTRSLDPLAAAEFRSFLRDEVIRGQGATVLFASHTPAEVQQLADRVVLLHSGRMLAFETPDALRALAGVMTLDEAIEVLLRRAAVEA